MAPESKDSRGRFRRGQAINPAALRQARRAAGMTLAQAATGIVTRQAFFQFEHGLARPKRQTLQAIAERLRVPMQTLLARAHDPRERDMRELAEKRQWPDLEQAARQVLTDANVTPRTLAVARFYLGLAIIDPDPGQALSILRDARGELAQLGEPWLAAEARDWEGVALYYLEDPAALEVGRDALGRYRALTDRDPGIEARMLQHVGSYLLQRQEVAEALACYHRAMEVGGPVLDLSRLANIHHGLASGCLRIGESRAALEYFERAVMLSRVHHDMKASMSASLPRLENDYGDCLVRLGRWERAEEMIHASLKHFAEAGVETGKAGAMLTMGDLKQRQGLLDEALRWTNDAIEQAQQQGEMVLLAAGYQQFGELSATLGDRDQVELSFSRAFRILDELDLPERRTIALERYRRARDTQMAAQRGL